MRTTSTNLEYFASISQDKPDELANAVMEKIRLYREWCGQRGLVGLWSKKLRNYYGNAIGGNSSQAVTRGGSEGELSMIKVNDLHSLVQEQLVIVTSQRPAGVAKAINSDTDSLKAARIGTAIAEYYMAQVGFESKFVTAAEIALLCDESYVELFWDKSAGDPIAVDPETQQPEMSGDAVLRVHAAWNVARDPGAIIQNNLWNILSFKMNKFDAAAKYPKFYDHIISIQSDDLPVVPMNYIPDGSDEIYVHLLVHDRCAAVQSGRYSLLIGNKIVLDTSLPFKDYPIERIAPSDVIDGNMGYAPANDILAMEEVTDALHSVVVTNQVTFGGQCIVGPEGANIKQSDLGKGVRYFELPPDLVDKLKPLMLTHTPPEIFNYIGMLGDRKGKAVGSVSNILSQQASQGASGSSMALIQTQAISFNSGIQRSYFQLLSGAMTKLIGILRTYADTPRVASIVGKSKAAGLKEFKYTGQDLNSISSIVYEIVNPIFQTYGGRLTVAQDLLKAGQCKSPKQYINLVATGQLDVLVDDDEADGMLILEENEALTEGSPVKAVVTEIHTDHIKSHNSLITQDAKMNDPNLVSRVLDHIQDHINVWQQASMNNPGILMVTGQQPLPMPPPPPGIGGPPPPGLPPPHGAGPPPAPGHGPMPPPHPGAPEGLQKVTGAPGVEQKAQGVKAPSLPNVAGTKNKPTIPGVTDTGGV